MGSYQRAAGFALAAFTALSQTLYSYAEEPAAVPVSASAAPVSGGSVLARYAGTVHMAYVLTGTSNDEAIKDGVETLSAFIGSHTSLNEKVSDAPLPVVGINIETISQDELKLLPWIYWSIQPNAQALSPKAQEKLRDYIKHGGFIVFDVAEPGVSVSDSAALKRVLGGVTLKYMTDMKQDHILTKQIFCTQGLPGVKSFGTLWVENTPKGSETVSSVIIGNNRWADAWSGFIGGKNSETQKKALWAGTNMFAYARLGPYKEDAAHAMACKPSPAASASPR